MLWIAPVRVLPGLSLLAFAFAQAPPPPQPQAPPQATAPELHGRVDVVDGLRVLHTWGTPRERGFSHGVLLGNEVATLVSKEFGARFARKAGTLAMVRSSLPRLIEYPKAVRQEIEGLYDGVLQSGADRRMPELDREFDLDDLLVANALDVFGLMGCSGFTLYDEQVLGGGVLSARNFDWPYTGPHMIDGTILLVQHYADGGAVASVTWPGYVGVVTGINAAGFAVFLHVGTGNITFNPEPLSSPTAIAARAILEQCHEQDTATAYALALSLLAETSPPAGYLTRVCLPSAPDGDVPFAVFEADSRKVLRAAVDRGCVITNHFLGRKDGRLASKDSTDRQQSVQQGIDLCIKDGDHKVAVDEAWQLLAAVERGGKRAFGTLHSLVFRPAPWCFELRIAEHNQQGLNGAPSSSRRFVLPRESVFPAKGPWQP
jgi:hypothetical protein